MNPIKAKAIDFLKRHQMDFEDIDMDVYCRFFLDEMEKGLAGENSSLAMIPTYIEVDKDVPVGEQAIVLDAGGTNFRVATVYFKKEGAPVIENLKTHSMPGATGRVNREAFFNTMAGYMEDVLGKSQKIGFCFSYAAEILPNRDGRLIRFSKEVQAEGVEGQLIGSNLLQAIRSKGHEENRNLVLLNDTVATLLAGKSKFRGRRFDSYIGFVLGTGTNCSYIEENRKIPKTRGLSEGKSQIVNMESGSFGKGPRGRIDLLFDMTTIDPEMYTFEKMISGAYLGELALKTLKMAAEEGLFSEKLKRAIMNTQHLETRRMNDLMCFPFGENNPLTPYAPSQCDDDCRMLYYLCDRLIERAALLTAINISAPIIKSDKGENPCCPVCVTAEGSVFYGLKSLKSRAEYYLKKFLIEKRERNYEIISVENATLIGAAIAALTN
jgi:hexokinase